MPNQLYDKGREYFGDGGVNWTADTNIKVILIDTAQYTVNLATHATLADVPAGARVATGTLTGKTNVGGVLDAADTVISSVSGPSVEAFIIVKDPGTGDANARLLFYGDQQSGGSTFSIPTNGGSFTLVWDNGANKILKL